MSVLLLLRALILPIIFQHAQTIAAALATSSAVVEPQQNLTFNSALLSEPSLTGSSQIHWQIDSTPYSLTFSKYAPGRDERDFYAAIISAQTEIFAAYLDSSSPYLPQEEIDYDFYGVNIEISNYELDLTYAITSKVLGEVGAFLQHWKKCEVEWTLVKEVEGRGTGNVVSVGQIRRGARVAAT